MDSYLCKTCGSKNLVVRAMWLVADLVWQVYCDQGHLRTPMINEEIRIGWWNLAVRDEEVPQLDS